MNVYSWFVLDELKYKLNLNVDDIDRLTLEDIRCQVDHAISQVNLFGL